jgi:hypothetical protein
MLETSDYKSRQVRLLMMKKTIVFILAFALAANTGFAQMHAKHRRSVELGGLLGVSYYIGDLNQTKQFLYSNPAGGLIFRYNFNPRLTWQFHALFGKIEGHDSHSSSAYQVQRNLNFRSHIFEVGSQLEFNFYNYSIGNSKERFTPYIFIGLGIFSFSPQGQLPNGHWVQLQPLHTEGEGMEGGKKKPYPLVQISVPFGVGVKANLFSRFSIGLEWGMRKTFTDYLDDVHGKYYDKSKLDYTGAYFSDPSIGTDPNYSNVGRQRGTATNKDWYSFAGITITMKLNLNKEKCPTPF